MGVKIPRKQRKLQIIKKENRAFDCFATIKPDAYCMPSKFYATTVYYPATKEETQTFLTTIDAAAYKGTEKVKDVYLTDEFDTARDALKWIKQTFAEFLKIV
ncbi:MAG: hypothetical protein HFE46_06925 [Clostridia bacterium]|jgi:hypothetical protein|nr:hypothetical protein [Clostridia bacterium]